MKNRLDDDGNGCVCGTHRRNSFGPCETTAVTMRVGQYWSRFDSSSWVLSGQKQVALENAATSPVVGCVKARWEAAKIAGDRDRFLWIALRMIWKDWKSILMIVRHDTVISWQRNGYKRYWCRLSQAKGPGRPRVASEIGKLVNHGCLESVLGHRVWHAALSPTFRLFQRQRE
jgi:hypothetical protein